MAQPWDDLVKELTSLRRKRGLTLQALSKCPTVLAVMNNPPLQEAFEHLVREVGRLGDDERAQALSVAYGLGMKQPGLLIERREQLHRTSGRDLKTLASYENFMIRELASRLMGSTRPEVSQSEVTVVGYLAGHHLRQVTVTVTFPPDAEGNQHARSVEYDNTSTLTSMPALIYQLPHDWEPRKLTLGLVLSGEPPTRFWASPARELLDLMFGSYGGPLPVQDGQVSIEVTGPKVGVLYAIYWTQA